MLNWDSVENSHIIILQQGKAVITEKQQGAKTIYLPHVEDKQGNIIASFEPGFEDFETADGFIDANLIELDRIGVDQAEFQRKLTATLDYSISLLIEPNRVFHRKRLDSIKSWLTNQPANYNTDDLPQTNWKNYIFDWHIENNQYQVEVPPHGKALIVEETVNPQSRFLLGYTTNYGIQIKDPTGITMSDIYAPLKDFNNAEERLRTVLNELENPFVDESYLEHLSFTLQICQRLLPPNTDLMEYVRLQFIETYLGEVLP